MDTSIEIIQKIISGGRDLDPVAFTVFGISIRWYGILIACGIACGCLIVSKRAGRHHISSEDILDVLIVSVIAGIIGARAYYVIFNWSWYEGNLMKILNIREGGLAIHGGLIFGILAGYFMCRHKKIGFLNALDLVLPAVALAQAIGRWGNFFNGEAHGGPTDLPWGIMVDGVRVHPTFLYESIWCLIIFIVLSRLDRHRKFTGQICCLYGILYSVERFFVEALRTDSLMIGPFKQAQVISIVIFCVCLAGYIVLQRRRNKKQITKKQQ